MSKVAASTDRNDLARQLEDIANEGPMIHLIAWSDIQRVCVKAATALRSSGPESEAVSLLRDILLLPANEQQLEYLHRGSGTATHFAVLLRAEKFLHSLGATEEKP
jgi:hypothetical protein